MTKNCKECESDIMDKYAAAGVAPATRSAEADLEIKYERALQHILILNECLDTKEKLNEFYRREIEELENKVRIYKNE